MSLFCLLWMPFFYLFWRALRDENAGSGGVWALFLGLVVSVVQFFLGDLVEPGGFGFSRWVSAFVDIIALPALLPILVYLFFIIFKAVSGPFDFANFALLWLIPGAAIRSFVWNSRSDPVFLILSPLLWTAIAVGISFFIGLILNRLRWYVIIPSALGILLVPFAAVSSWYAFFAGNLLWAYCLLAAALIPLVISLAVSLFKIRS